MTRTTNALDILDRVIGDDAQLQEMIAEEERKLRIARLIYDARTAAGLTQAELAVRMGTRQSTIARLEDADYGSQSLTMLYRIAKALSLRLEVNFVSPDPAPRRDETRRLAQPLATAPAQTVA